MGAIDVKQTSEHELTLEWDSSASNDMIADSTLALITGIDKSPASVKRIVDSTLITLTLNANRPYFKLVTTHQHSHAHDSAPEQPHPHADIDDEKAVGMRIQRLAMFLEAHFGEVELHMPDLATDEQPEESPEPALLVRLDEADALINLLTMVRA